jgi:hypothetical protein
MAKLSQLDAAYILKAAIEITSFLEVLPENALDRNGKFVFDPSQVGRLRAKAALMRDRLLIVIPQEVEIEESAT